MSPHPAPWLDTTYADRTKVKMQADMDKAQHVIDITNACLRCSAECLLDVRTEADCDKCNRPECRQAYDDWCKLIKEIG